MHLLPNCISCINTVRISLYAVFVNSNFINFLCTARPKTPFVDKTLLILYNYPVNLYKGRCKKMIRKMLSFVLVCLTLLMCVSCTREPTVEVSSAPPAGVVTKDVYTYNDYLAVPPESFSPFCFVTESDRYIADLTQWGLYEYALNESGDGYTLLPEMAAAEPKDVTELYAGEEKWGIPQGETGYAYKISLNQSAVWQSGEKITADDYIFSMQQLLSSEHKYYRALTFAEGETALAGGGNYYRSNLAGTPIYRDNLSEGNIVHPMAAWKKGVDGTYTTADGAKLYFITDMSLYALGGYSIEQWNNASENGDFSSCLNDFAPLKDENGLVPVTEESIAALHSFTGSAAWGYESRERVACYVFYADGTHPYGQWSDVGFLKTGEYEITLIFENKVQPFALKQVLTDCFIVHKATYEADPKKYGTDSENYMSCGPYSLTAYLQNKRAVMEKNSAWYGYTDGNHVGQFVTDTVDCQVITDKTTAVKYYLAGKLDRLLSDSINITETAPNSVVLHTPLDYTTKLSFNGDIESLYERESKGINKTILAYKDFRKAISLCINRSVLCSTLSDTHTPGYGLLNYMYVANSETGKAYRDTLQAQQALAQLYGLETDADINGYDIEAARTLMAQAYSRCYSDGNIGSDDKVYLELSVAEKNGMTEKTASYINLAVNTAASGTPLEGRVEIALKVDENYYESSRYGETDIILTTLDGTDTDIYSMLEGYCVNGKHYEYGFNADLEMLTLDINGAKDTKTFGEWYNALVNGAYAQADEATRLSVVAGIEAGILSRYYTVPLYYRTTTQLCGEKVTVGAAGYLGEMGFGGIRYLKYNYTDAAWAAHLNEKSE